MTPEPWITKRELARKLGVSERTIVRLGLPHMRVGGQNRYRMSECERQLRGGAGDDENVVELRPRQGRGQAA